MPNSQSSQLDFHTTDVAARSTAAISTVGKLWQLIYLSVSQHDFTHDDLATLLAKARLNNQR